MKMRAENRAVDRVRFAKQTSIPTIRPAAIAAFLCGLVLLARFTGPAQAQTDASQIALQHPGWVLVPGAIVRPDCVHQIPNGAGPRIENGRDTGDVSLNGIVIVHYDPCPEDATIRLAEGTSESSVITNSTGSGLVEDSFWDDTSLASSDNIDLVSNNLTVPTKPSKNGGVILLYDALQDSTGGYVFAPALQYGVNFGVGGNYWSLQAYFVTPSNTYLSSTSLKVSKGESIYLLIQIFSASGGIYNWGVQALDLLGNGAALNEAVSGLHWNFAVSGALTVANLTSCSEFPATKAVFTDTVVDHGWPSFKKLTPKWVGATYAYGGPACGFSVTPGNKTILKY